MNMDDKLMCKACGKNELSRFISFGKMPIANAFLTQQDLNKQEYFYNMEVGFCESCKMVQLVEMPSYENYIVPDAEGKTQYAFFSSTSKFMEDHFAEMAKTIETRFLSQESKVLEIGSNDGIMLRAFKKNRVLGVEPSHNVADVAIGLGIETIKSFFDENLARKIREKYGQFKAITSTNVFLNIIDIESATRGVSHLLEDKGVFVTEDPYILDILEKNSYDQVYDEHVWYFSLTSLAKLYERHGMELFDAERQWVHGGSIRAYAAKKGAYPQTERLLAYLKAEKEKKIDTLEPYKEFAKRVEDNKNKFISLLKDLRNKGKIVGYAAASKGTIVQNYCNIGPETLSYISDSTPFKQGRFSPGKHIPIVNPEKFRNDMDVKYAVLGAWNHAKEIMGKEKEFVARGGKFVVHLPYPHIVEMNEFDNLQESKFPGVETKQLKIWANDQGYLFETIRSDDKLFDGKYGQTLVSVLNPGVIKGLHKHEKQTDYSTCIKGNVKYVVIKETEGGKAEIKTYILGESNPVLIKTPPGYWHGYMPLGNEKAIMLHLSDKTYDPKDDDTQRKDVYAFGDPWTVKHS